uniref:Uncharacterized protein LOC114339202 n=1 Tax=Diabrotica virgifera virgifera TaxID=50390 RepID=A0A6P7GPC6_DIAVI
SIVNALWYLRNCNLYRDLQMDTVSQRINKFAKSHEQRLSNHVNIEAIKLLDNSNQITRLKTMGDLPPPKYRVLGERPVFRLHSLQPGKDYQVAVYAENAKGKSYPPVILPNVRVENPMSSQYFNADDAQSSEVVPTAENSTSSMNLTAIIVGLACAAVILIISIVSVSAILACKKPKTGIVKRRRSSKPPDEFDLSEDGFGEGFHRRSAQYRASMYGECEERISRMIEGPDLIFSPITNSQNSLEF